MKFLLITQGIIRGVLMNKVDRVELSDQKAGGVEAQTTQSTRKWSRATLYLGLALAASIGSVVPFLYGNPLHSFWDTFGVGTVAVSMGLLLAFLYAAATTLNLRYYGANLAKTNRSFAKPGGKRKSGR
jgi:hypothetical protein